MLLMKVIVRYYKTSRGDQPAQRYLDEISEKDRARVFALIEKLALEGNLQMPHGKKIVGQKNLYEIRYRRHRILYCYYKDKAILLHAFIKKTQETPKKDLNLSLERKKDFE